MAVVNIRTVGKTRYLKQVGKVFRFTVDKQIDRVSRSEFGKPESSRRNIYLLGGNAEGFGLGKEAVNLRVGHGYLVYHDARIIL